jgi:NADH dehydrogenase FAD-containing subunit
LNTDASHVIGSSVQAHLKDAGITCITDAECTEISGQGVHIKYGDGKTEVIPADSIILAAGMQSTENTVKSMLDCAVDVIPVGDCIKPGTVRQTSRTGYYAALDI